MVVKRKRAATSKSRQPYLHPDLEPPSIPEIDGAAEAYQEIMLERVDLSKAEHEAKTQLIEFMVKHQQTRYTTRDGLIIDLLSRSNVKLHKKKEQESNGVVD